MCDYSSLIRAFVSSHQYSFYVDLTFVCTWMFVTNMDSLYLYNTGYCPLSDRGEPVPKSHVC
jgi:hypothetical protein